MEKRPARTCRNRTKRETCFMGCKGSRVRIPAPRPIESITWAVLRSGLFICFGTYQLLGEWAKMSTEALFEGASPIPIFRVHSGVPGDTCSAAHDLCHRRRWRVLFRGRTNPLYRPGFLVIICFASKQRPAMASCGAMTRRSATRCMVNNRSS